jgi:selenide,water dikinase
MYRKGVGTGSNLPNRLMVQNHLEIEATLSKAEEQLLFDPQTSGGLLLSIPESQADELLSSLLAVGETSSVRVGEVVDGPPALVVV